MKTDSEQILILGAGPAGMATAMELWKAGRASTVVEKNDRVGGLARTLEFAEGTDIFRTDIGPHRFFSKNPYLYSFIEDLLQEEWIIVDRHTRFFIDGKYYQYPLRWRNALVNLGITGTVRVLADYFLERVKDAFRTSPPNNFEEFATRTFGRTLAELNMLNYTHKIWGVRCQDLSVDWAQQRIKGLTFWSAVKSAFTKDGDGAPKSLVDSFFYPSRGTGLIYETIKGRTAEDSNYLLQSMPTELSHVDGRIVSVTIQTPNGEKQVSPEHVVTSIPITELLRLLNPAPPEEVREAAVGLRFRSQVYLFLTVDKNQIVPDQWVYFPESEIPFGRVSEMKNFSSEMAPPDKTSLFIEFFCWENDSTWNASAEDLLEKALPWMEKFGWLSREDIRHTYIHRQANVYPVYDLAYAERLKTITEYVDAFSNLFAIGRPGRFKYNNQDHSLEMGILAARSIIEGKRYDVEHVASGSEYFESGYTPESPRPQSRQSS